jgi:A/G-specific adenine glycosylase
MPLTLKSASSFIRNLLAWYRIHKRDLPWRRTHDPYKIWVSEVMLQQTTVPAVVPHYKSWLDAFPDIGDLARAPERKVLKAWQGLGYYQRARNLHRAAKSIVQHWNGKIPGHASDLRKLPGFGPYTTAAVLSLAYGQPYPVIDANARRVMRRVLRLHGEANSGQDKTIQPVLEKIFPVRRGAEFNQALMELGALLCRSRNPRCALCPLQPHCLAFARGEQEVIPKPRFRSYRKITAVVGLIKKDGRYLIQKRPDRGLLAGLWEFPGGKVKPGETPRQALVRELREELGVGISEAPLLGRFSHSYTRFRVDLRAYACRLEGDPKFDSRACRWVRLAEIARYPMPSGSARIVSFLMGRRTEKNNLPGRELWAKLAS